MLPLGITNDSYPNLWEEVSGIHPEFSFPVILDMFTYPERCPPALSVYVLTHPDP